MIQTEKMIKVAYLECPTGIAGDMCLGALVDAGVPLDYLTQMLNRLGIDREYNLWAEPVLHNGQRATKVHVELLPPITHSQENHQPSDKQIHYSDPNRSAKSQDLEPHAHPTHSHSPEPPHAHEPSHAHEPTHAHLAEHFHSHEHSHPITPSLSAVHLESSNSIDHHSHRHSRHLPEIEALIKAARLPERVEAWSLEIFRQLAAAEGAVHGISPQDVHFHEVGATDAIVDIVGTCLGLDWLNIERLYCSALPTGGGLIRAAHGWLPVPAPAVLKLWEMRQIPIYSNGIQRELVTPTGAAIVTALASEFGNPPAMTLQQVGLGAGSRNLEIPNILRLWLGEQKSDPDASHRTSAPRNDLTCPVQTDWTATHAPSQASLASTSASSSLSHQAISVLETQMDDLSPQAIGYLYEVLFAAGAFDVFTQAIGMKKSRLGVLLTVICPPECAETCEAVIFRETTTLGIRRSTQQRSILPRTFQTVETPYGTVRIKVTDRGTHHGLINGHPEYEDCARLARQHKVAWQEIHRTALQCWYETCLTVSQPEEP